MARGHKRKRGNAWELRVSAGFDPASGKRRVITRTVRGTARDADRALTALLGELDEGAHRGPDATLRTLLDRWWDHHKATWQPNTRRGYAGYRRRYLAPHEDMRVSDITTEWLDQRYVELLQTLSPATVYKIHTMYDGALADAVRWGWLVRNPAERADPPTVGKPKIKVPPTATIRAALDALAERDIDFYTLVHVDAVSGVRPGEVCGFQWADLVGSDMAVRRTVVMDEHRQILVVDRTKTDDDRIVPLDPATLALIEAHRLRWKDRLAAAGVDLAGDHFMFPRRFEPDVPVHPAQIGQRWRRVRSKVGLDRVRFYDLRHAMVTRLLDDGIPVHDVAARAGHSPTMTMTRYAHPTTEAARRAGDAAAL